MSETQTETLTLEQRIKKYFWQNMITSTLCFIPLAGMSIAIMVREEYHDPIRKWNYEGATEETVKFGMKWQSILFFYSLIPHLFCTIFFALFFYTIIGIPFCVAHLVLFAMHMRMTYKDMVEDQEKYIQTDPIV